MGKYLIKRVFLYIARDKGIYDILNNILRIPGGIYLSNYPTYSDIRVRIDLCFPEIIDDLNIGLDILLNRSKITALSGV